MKFRILRDRSGLPYWWVDDDGNAWAVEVGADGMAYTYCGIQVTNGGRRIDSYPSDFDLPDSLMTPGAGDK